MTIEEIQEKSDRELIDWVRDPYRPIPAKDMHGIALVLARRLEESIDRLREHESQVNADRESARHEEYWATQVEMEAS